MFLISVVLFRPAEQTLARYVAERVTRGEDARPVARAVAWLIVAALVIVTLAMAAAWQPITDQLFGGHSYVTACLLAGIAAYAVSYYVRGIASGLQWFGGYGVLLLVDGAARVVLALPLVFIASPPVAAAAMVAAALLGAVAPLMARDNGPKRLLARLRGRESAALGLAGAARFALPVGIIAGAEQTLVSGGALLAAITTDGDAAAAAGTVFAATMLVRAPVFLFQGVAAALLPRFTEMRTRGDQAASRRTLALAGGGTFGLSVVLAAGALLCGPELMRLLFGPDFAVGRVDLAILSAGVGCYLAAATLSQAALARALAASAAAAWLTGAAIFVAIYLEVSGDALHRVSWAFTLATGLIAALLAIVLRSRQTD
ncbi:MAG TPA: hypothetical protein VI300_00650, partial [Solirubrobacter sp.]